MSHQQDIPRHSKDSFIFFFRKTGEFRVKIRKVWSTQMKKFWLAPISNKSLLPLPFQLCPVQTRYFTLVLNYFVCDVVHCKCIPTFPAFMHPLSLLKSWEGLDNLYQNESWNACPNRYGWCSWIISETWDLTAALHFAGLVTALQN